jgi:hypothetical protein
MAVWYFEPCSLMGNDRFFKGAISSNGLMTHAATPLKRRLVPTRLRGATSQKQPSSYCSLDSIKYQLVILLNCEKVQITCAYLEIEVAGLN